MNFLPSPLLSALALASLISLQAGAAVIQSIERSYDPLGRLSKETRSDGGWVSYGYDANGNRTESRDHLGRVTLYGYDALNRLISQTDPAGGLTRFSYDAQDNLVSVTDPRGLITQYQYNGLNELLRQISPDTGTTVVARLESGLTASVTDAKQQTTSYAYDTAGRLSALTYADGKTLSYGYGSSGTSTGKLTSLSDASGSITYTHDSQGRVATETRTIWSKPYLTRYGYDAQGRLAKLTYPSGRSVSYSYDSAGQVSLVQTQLGTAAAKTVLSNLSYRPFGQVQGWTYGNGEVRSSSYDNLNQLTTLSLGDSTLTLSYDNAGRITSQQISGGWWERLLQKLGLPVGQTHRYRYDALDRLTEWEDGRVVMRNGFPYSPSNGYDYDATGNRQSHRADDMVFKQYIDAKSNRLTAASYPDMRNPVFEYDANGSRIQEGGNHYSYDARGRLIEVAGAQFTVNALGERVAKTYQGATTLFQYDQWGRLIAETDANGAVKREYLYLGELPVALVDNGLDLRNIYTDHLGTPRLVTDATQHAIWAWPLGEPFGNTPANEDPESTGGKYTFNLRFPGQYFDKETGHHYNYFRDYDPQNGRYVQSDPIGLAGGINTYVYVESNPLSYNDPDGLKVNNYNGRSYGSGNAAQRRYDRRHRPFPPNIRSSNTANAEEAGGYYGETGEFVCLRWKCQAETHSRAAQECLANSDNGRRKFSDFIPPATSIDNPPTGCSCDYSGYKPAATPGYKSGIDYFELYNRGRKNWWIKGLFR